MSLRDSSTLINSDVPSLRAMRRPRRTRLLDRRLRRILEYPQPEIPLVTDLTAVRRNEEKTMKYEFHSPAPSGPVA